jgi:hypothetical protein
MMSINHHGLALSEVPFGGVTDAGYGLEGGLEATESCVVTKFVSESGLSARRRRPHRTLSHSAGEDFIEKP